MWAASMLPLTQNQATCTRFHSSNYVSISQGLRDNRSTAILPIPHASFMHRLSRSNIRSPVFIVCYIAHITTGVDPSIITNPIQFAIPYVNLILTLLIW